MHRLIKHMRSGMIMNIVNNLISNINLAIFLNVNIMVNTFKCTSVFKCTMYGVQCIVYAVHM